MANSSKDVFYVHEKYARRMANRRFVGGLALGMLIVYTMPMYKACRDVVQTTLKKWKEEHGYSGPETSDSEESSCDESDFV